MKKSETWQVALADLMAATTGLRAKDRLPLPADPWRFVLECCWTYDELAELMGQPPYRRFPNKTYLETLTRLWLVCRALRVEKSRQLMVTWLMAALWLWWVLTKRGQRVAWLCKKHDAAVGHIENRVWRMYQRIPARYDKPLAKFTDGTFEVYHDGAGALWTSRIEPIAAESGKKSDAASQLRSETYSAIFWDEAPFQEGQAETYAAGLPCIGAGGRFVIVGSANGRCFVWRIGHANVTAEGGDAKALTDLAMNKEEVARGIDTWELNGFSNVRLHYTSDPDKDPETDEGKAWMEAVRPRYPGSKWDREMEIDHDVQPGKPVFTDANMIHRGPQYFDPALPVVRGWDFQYSYPYCVWLQVRPVRDEATGEVVQEDVYFLLERYMPSMPLESFVTNYVLPTSEEFFPGAKVIDYGDPAGNQRRAESPMSCVQILQALGIALLSQPVKVDTRIQVFQGLITHGQVHIDPEGCPMLYAAISGGYYRDEHDRPVKDGVNDHPADAAGYAVMNLFGFRPEGRSVTAYRPRAAAVAAKQAGHGGQAMGNRTEGTQGTNTGLIRTDTAGRGAVKGGAPAVYRPAVWRRR